MRTSQRRRQFPTEIRRVKPLSGSWRSQPRARQASLSVPGSMPAAYRLRKGPASCMVTVTIPRVESGPTGTAMRIGAGIPQDAATLLDPLAERQEDLAWK